MKQLRITLLAGLILLVLAGCVLTVFFIMDRRGTDALTRQQDSFNRLLREFDADFSDIYRTDREIDRLGSLLDKMENRAVGVESWLSILKRRRAIASLSPSLISHYRSTIEKALVAYPLSQPIVMIAAADLIKNAAITRETEEKLRIWLLNITDPSFNDIALSIHILLGDFKNPETALLLPENIFTDGTQDISLNFALLKTLRGDVYGASADIQDFLNLVSPSANTLRFCAEFLYDFGDLLRSAEIFSMLNDEYSTIRQADALYLGGYAQMAASIWNILAQDNNETSLYNLAVSASDDDEALPFLEKLVNLESVSNKNSRQFALIRYSRLMEYQDALRLLRTSTSLMPEDFPYIDLEIVRRHSRSLHPDRQISETWLLLDRHERNEDLYKWAFWHLFFKRYFNDTRILLDRMNLMQISAPWIDEYRAIQNMLDGNLENAERLFRSVPEADRDWSLHANLGRVLENMSLPARAIEQYERAFELAQDNRNASRIMSRMARCYTALSRPQDARQAYLRAVELDSANVGAKLEFDRLSR
ncbi:MAG: tetratricopeptide repeat protein [Treponema sp.]|nr:tetratricopeptide repeat protein [Treponema sp.]MCL2236701.1 tetratricopeptide repeat protein [Treponema sp.]